MLGKIEGKKSMDDRGWDGWMAVLGVGDGQGSLACCSPWGPTVKHDWATELNWIWIIIGRKAMTNLDSILKSRDITFPSKEHLVKAIVFPVVMYGCESWTVKKAEHQRMDAFELRCWRRLLRVHWTARRSNQWVLREISPDYSLEGLMLRLKLQYFGHLMRRTDSLERPCCWERLKTGGEGATEDETVGCHHWLKGREFEQLLGDSEGQGSLACYSPWGHKESDTTEGLNKSNHYKEFKWCFM